MNASRFRKKIKALTKRNILILLGIVIISSSLLIIVNYFTIRIISSVRAYIQGENQYSKSQKDASLALIMYIHTKDTAYWGDFQEEIKVPIGDSLARTGMMQNASHETIKKGFLQGRVHKDDLDDMIWLFQNFHRLSFINQSIKTWQQADVLVGQLHRLGQQVHQKISRDTLSSSEQQETLEEINILTAKLTEKERAFSENLGTAAREINQYLFYANFAMTLLTIGSATAFAMLMFKRLKAKNSDLRATNEELDQFVYSASHDLRAPLTSLKGLLEIIQQEEVTEPAKTYLQLMEETLDKQDLFIREIIDFSRNKRMAVVQEEVNISSLLQDAIAQHKHISGKSGIIFEKNIQIDKIISDPLRLKIIFNNLLSNAIKYSDPDKENQYIKINMFYQQDKYIIEIADNGIGIKEEHQERIFNMFFTTRNRNSGSGLGLYMVWKTVCKLGGSVKVKSEIGKGSTFIISLPLKYENQM